MNSILLTQRYSILPALRSNLAIALFLLPRAKRKDALFFYEFCHTIDAIADHPLLSFNEKEKQLSAWMIAVTKADATYVLSGSAFSAPFFEMVVRRKIDGERLCEIIRGVQMDLTIHRYSTFEELRLYLWRVASVVGLISAELFDAKGDDVNNYAEQLGIALQLTNILRDVAEDALMGRIYLPLEDLARFQITEKEILESTSSPKATHLFNHEAERALSYFAKAECAWEKLTPREHRLLRPARLMEAIYRELLHAMQHNRYDLFHRRYQVSLTKKLMLALQVIFFTK
ncbi:MAG: phytoene/squalene synthase family protein [Chthoniobacterales bacterium]